MIKICDGRKYLKISAGAHDYCAMLTCCCSWTVYEIFKLIDFIFYFFYSLIFWLRATDLAGYWSLL